VNGRTAAIVILCAISAPGQKPASRPPVPAPAVPPPILTNPIVSQFEDGDPVQGKLVVGELAFFRFTVANFKVSEDGKVKITGHAQLFDSRGAAVAPPEELGIASSLRDEDKDWRPRVHAQFQLPGIAPPGAYRIRFDAVDEQTHQKAEAETAFEVAGRDVPASPSLVIRGAAFYRGAEDEAALGVAAYRPGDTVWIRFDITGYKYGEQNSIDVAYDVAVSGPDGKQVFAQENAAVEKSQAVYPQPWVPGAFSLTLTGDTAKGAYSVAITARDATGKQSVTEKAEFRVE
jgi:hypothetical protein